jgi:hypothetical protein
MISRMSSSISRWNRVADADGDLGPDRFHPGDVILFRRH